MLHMDYHIFKFKISIVNVSKCLLLSLTLYAF